MKIKRFFEFSHNVIINACEMSYVEGASGTLELLKNYDSLLKYCSKGADKISLREELKVLNNYIFIQKMRYGNLFDIHINVEEIFLDFSIDKFYIINCLDNLMRTNLKQSTDYIEYFITFANSKKTNISIMRIRYLINNKYEILEYNL